jgi:hypothetical protein
MSSTASIEFARCWDKASHLKNCAVLIRKPACPPGDGQEQAKAVSGHVQARCTAISRGFARFVRMSKPIAPSRS